MRLTVNQPAPRGPRETGAGLASRTTVLRCRRMASTRLSPTLEGLLGRPASRSCFQPIRCHDVRGSRVTRRLNHALSGGSLHLLRRTHPSIQRAGIRANPSRTDGVGGTRFRRPTVTDAWGLIVRYQGPDRAMRSALGLRAVERGGLVDTQALAPQTSAESLDDDVLHGVSQPDGSGVVHRALEAESRELETPQSAAYGGVTTRGNDARR